MEVLILCETLFSLLSAAYSDTRPCRCLDYVFITGRCYHSLSNVLLDVWLECRFLDTEVDGSNPGISILCPFYIYLCFFILNNS